MPQARNGPEAELTLRLERIEPDCNRRRYYELSLGRSLFYDSACEANDVHEAAGKADARASDAPPVTLTRRWGRIGRPGRERIELHRNLADAAAALDRWRRAKERRGYAIAELTP